MDSISAKPCKRSHYRKCMGFLIAVVVMASGCNDNADLPRNSQTIEGMTIELGVVPLKRVKEEHATLPGDPEAMHGGTTANSSSAHIVVALFDAKTGVRIADAEIQASVGNPGHSRDSYTSLEPMEMGGVISYGNYFMIQGTDALRIHLVIHRPGVTRAIEAEFSYEQT